MIIFGKKIFLVSLIFFLIFLFLGVFVIPSLTGSLKRDAELFISLKKTTSLLDKQIADFKQFEDRRSFYSSKLSEVKDSFITPDVPIEFLEFLEKKADRLDLSIKISPINIVVPDKDLWPSLGFQVLVTGSSPRCLRYLEEVQASRWLLSIRDVEIQRIPEKDFSNEDVAQFSPGDVYMIFSLKIYSQSQISNKE